MEKSLRKEVLLFEDLGKDSWEEKWMLDGLQAKVINSNKGMELIAGNKFQNDSSHAVLWTKREFKGNIRIEYDYTKTDTTTRCVNILYFHALGKGDEEFPTDIAQWSEKRTVPRMELYYNNMYAYHISYAAFSAREYSGENDYIKLRRYDPSKNGLDGTEIPDKLSRTGLFKPNTTYQIKVEKNYDQIKMRVRNKENPSENLTMKWDASIYPILKSGRIGLRHMYTRSARYKNFRVWQLNNE